MFIFVVVIIIVIVVVVVVAVVVIAIVISAVILTKCNIDPVHLEFASPPPSGNKGRNLIVWAVNRLQEGHQRIFYVSVCGLATI